MFYESACVSHVVFEGAVALLGQQGAEQEPELLVPLQRLLAPPPDFLQSGASRSPKKVLVTHQKSCSREEVSE